MHQVIGAFALGSCLGVGSFLQDEIYTQAVWRSLDCPCDNEAWRGISLTARPAMRRVRDSYAFGLERPEMDLACSM